MDTVPLKPWQPNETELVAADRLLGHLATRFPLTTRDRVREIAATVAYARQILIEHGPATAVPGRANLGSLIVSALHTGHLAELEIFNGQHPSESEVDLLTLRPTLIADLEVAEHALAQLAQALEIVLPPLVTR